MRPFTIAIGAALTIASAIASTTSRVVFAQTSSAPAPSTQAARPPARPATAAKIPRLPDGHPDLQGTYDIATLTPVDRPRGAKNLVLTEQEAAAMEKYEAQRQVKNDAPLKGDRGAPPVGGETTAPKSYLEFLEQAGGGVVGGYNNFWLSGGDHVIRVDGQPRSSLIIDPPDGQAPPMKPEATKRNQAFLAGAAAPDASESGNSGPPGAFDGPETRPLAERCLLGFLNTSGPPTLPNYFYNNLKQIVQTKDTIVILVEMVHDARVIRMNAEHLPPTIRKWMGDSVGHWEGDTLVVDTTNFTGKTQFRGSSQNLHVVERFTRVDPKTLLYRFTVEDPSTWDRPWTGEYPWNATGEKLYEYACHEGNYSLPGMLRGARQKETEEAQKKN
ncbi:MAG TPA: hypothetical protein VKD69_07465 [Vicinamibacterales bacterium]|nr:hypothetical protein [Vicinamibacterales bacterium]